MHGADVHVRCWVFILMCYARYRELYQLYEGKPCITDTAEECRRCLNARITMIGKKVQDSVWGERSGSLSNVSYIDTCEREEGAVRGVSDKLWGTNVRPLLR